MAGLMGKEAAWAWVSGERETLAWHHMEGKLLKSLLWGWNTLRNVSPGARRSELWLLGIASRCRVLFLWYRSQQEGRLLVNPTTLKGEVTLFFHGNGSQTLPAEETLTEHAPLLGREGSWGKSSDSQQHAAASQIGR